MRFALNSKFRVLSTIDQTVRLCVATFLACAAVKCPGQGTLEPLHINFDGSPVVPVGWDIGVTEYYEHGMYFRPLGPADPANQFGRTGGGIPEFPENGTAYVHTGAGDSLAFSFLAGTLFNLDSVDLAEYSTVVPDARTVSFTGYRADSSTVNVTFTTDGIIDGTGPLADFQTFTFGPEFSNLLRVDIPGYGWSLDNLKLSRHIPEPTSVALLLLGTSLLGLRRLKRN